MENTIRKSNTTLDSYFPAPLSMSDYFAILDQNPSVLSVLQAPVDGNNDSVIMNRSFVAVCLYTCTHTCDVQALFSPCSVEPWKGEWAAPKGLSEKPALNPL